MSEIKFTIHGKVPSKSNCYKVITINGHGSLGKAKNLKDYEKSFFLQIPASARGLMIDRFMSVLIAIYYPSMRSDLDNGCKVILDCLQHGKVIKNDNLVTEIHLTKHIDKANPRCEISIFPEMPF